MLELEQILKEALPTWKEKPEYKDLFLADPSYNGIDEFQDTSFLHNCRKYRDEEGS